MARPKTTEAAATKDTEKTPEKEAKNANNGATTKDTEKIPADVEKLMKLYPQYEEIYVTPQGFVHTKDAAEYLLKDAVLYKNKYYKQ